MSSKSGLLLDLGCGIAERVIDDTMESVGVDIERRYLKVAKRRDPEIGLIVADAQCLPFRNQTFEKIGCYHLIEHIDRPSLVLKEMHRILRPQGSVEIEVPNGYSPLEPINRFFARIKMRRNEHKRLFSRRSLERIVREHGFEITERFNWGLLGPILDMLYVHLSYLHVPVNAKGDPVNLGILFPEYSAQRLTYISSRGLRKKISRFDERLVRFLPFNAAIIRIYANPEGILRGASN